MVECILLAGFQELTQLRVTKYINIYSHFKIPFQSNPKANKLTGKGTCGRKLGPVT